MKWILLDNTTEKRLGMDLKWKRNYFHRLFDWDNRKEHNFALSEIRIREMLLLSYKRSHVARSKEMVNGSRTIEDI